MSPPTRGPIVLVTGGRHYNRQSHVWRVLSEVQPRCVVQGGATGADLLAKKWAKANGVPCFECEANWTIYDQEAGALRNGWMIEFVKVDLCIAFPGGKGTENMVQQARMAQCIDVRDERKNQ